jgi:hypothetical protein
MGKKKISQMTPEEQEAQREEWRTAQAARREEQRLSKYVPTADEWRDEFAATEHCKTLNVHTKQFSAKVAEELGKEVGSVRVKTGSGAHEYYDDDGGYALDRVARTLLGLKRNWVKQVSDPSGELIAGSHFADPDCGFASELIESVYRHGLKKSPTFAASFRELLEMLDKRYGSQRTEGAAVVRAELAGTYIFVPHAPPQRTPEPKSNYS